MAIRCCLHCRTKAERNTMNFYSKTFSELSTCELYEILKARAQVFIVEQRINCQDMDGVDYDSLHCFIKDNDTVIGYLRAYLTDEPGTVKVGRVLSLHHGVGIGRRLMELSLPVVTKHFGCRKIVIHSQKYAAGFYEKFGFKTVSDDFIEEEIVHVAMELTQD